MRGNEKYSDRCYTHIHILGSLFDFFGSSVNHKYSSQKPRTNVNMHNLSYVNHSSLSKNLCWRCSHYPFAHFYQVDEWLIGISANLLIRSGYEMSGLFLTQFQLYEFLISWMRVCMMCVILRCCSFFYLIKCIQE